MNDFGTIICSNMAMHRDATFQSETISEVLWDEPFIIHKSQKDWIYIELLYDHYKGWIPASIVIPIEKGTALQMDNDYIPVHTFSAHKKCIIDSAEQHIHIPMGAMTKDIGRKIAPLHRIMDHLIGVSYRWGGRSSFGLDCSGLTQLLYKFIRHRIPRDASDQAKEGILMPFGEQKFGDLAFFGPNEQNISHVGFIKSVNQIFHASGSVKVETITKQGIINSKNEVTHQLLFIKRMK
ncbi:C40 family peptidase [Halosquirtibacter laminarini]|uniref:C40 family peptidase n=1 Tax=Halosquirtibacter laminarini TaxID=3374600 RepID=A0AC61NBW1_9BACT|nr:C40 family peptidase [Prolixibacteraceae bacterium]